MFDSWLIMFCYLCASSPHPERSLLAHALAQWHSKCRKSRHAEMKLQGSDRDGCQHRDRPLNSSRPTCIHLHNFTYRCIYIYIIIYTYTHIYIYTYIHTYINTYIHTYIHIYIYIYLGKLNRPYCSPEPWEW